MEASQIPQDLRDALDPILEALRVNDGSTLGRLIPDNHVVYIGENGYGAEWKVTTGDLRRIRDIVHAHDAALSPSPPKT